MVLLPPLLFPEKRKGLLPLALVKRIQLPMERKEHRKLQQPAQGRPARKEKENAGQGRKE